jgi:hypothetical protein
VKANEKNYFSNGTGDWFFIHFLLSASFFPRTGRCGKKVYETTPKRNGNVYDQMFWMSQSSANLCQEKDEGRMGQDLETDGGKTACHNQRRRTKTDSEMDRFNGINLDCRSLNAFGPNSFKKASKEGKWTS